MISVGIKAVPVSRSSHKVPTPKSGGVGIILAFFSGMAYLYLTGQIGYIAASRLAYLGLGSALTIAVSLIDDLQGLSFVKKILAQILSAFCVVAAHLYVHKIPLPGVGWLDLGWWGIVLSFFWVIFFMNVFNFMDGLNGQAGGVSLVASIFTLIISIFLREKALGYISYTLFWSTLGFLIFNFPKGRIFMGDVGSQFMGLIWGIVLLIPTQESHSCTTLSVYTVPILFFNFIYDVVVTVVRRILNGDPYWRAHRTHLFQLVNRLGYSHNQVTCFQMGVGALQGVGAVLVQFISPSYQIFIFVPYLIMMVFYHYGVYKKIMKISLKRQRRVAS